MNPTGDRGAVSELIACAWLMQNGYWAFRNQSPNGPVDIIAINRLTNEATMFDVKTVSLTSPNNPGCENNFTSKKLTDEQLAMGVKRLNIMLDGSCFVDAGDNSRVFLSL